MAVNTKAVKQRINTVKNTKKITNAMQMIAAVKMRKAVESAVKTRAYANLSSEILDRISKNDIDHALTKNRERKKELIIVLSSNRGLCGSYNTNVFKQLRQQIENDSNVEYNILALGRKSAEFARKLGLEIGGLYENFSENPAYEDVFPVSSKVIEDFKTNKFDKVSVIYTNYISGLSQKVTQKQLLPIRQSDIFEMIQDLSDSTDAYMDNENESDTKSETEFSKEYDFEPSRNVVLDYLLPILVEVQLYHAVLESTASEHSSRMIAMKNATESAGEMIEDLTLQFNKARQAAITQEVSEIVSGANALAI